ncbi:hypothetical protein M8818_007431 [Zalaria obscura]|uniref:Uncharacterized protein n=1 Tax=Zalaria obscura TaxID=2024903 RepID=A0ACC3S7C5_9PEZI
MKGIGKQEAERERDKAEREKKVTRGEELRGKGGLIFGMHIGTYRYPETWADVASQLKPNRLGLYRVQKAARILRTTPTGSLGSIMFSRISCTLVNIRDRHAIIQLHPPPRR